MVKPEDEMVLKAKRLTAASFSKFGKAIDIPKSPPLVETETVKYWGTIASFMVEGETEVGICIVKKDSNIIESMERHVGTPELIAPIEGDFVIPVAASRNLEDPNETPKVEDSEAFYVNEKQAFVMDKGVWHWAPFPVGKESSFYVIFKKETTKRDMTVKKFKDEKKISVVW